MEMEGTESLSCSDRHRILLLLVALCVSGFHYAIGGRDRITEARLFEKPSSLPYNPENNDTQVVLKKEIKAPRGTVYVCGYGKAFVNGSNDDILWRKVFPEYHFNVANFSANMNSTEHDIYLSDGGSFAPLCQHIFSNRKQYMRWMNSCNGKILITNPRIGSWQEGGYVDERIYQIGYRDDSPQSIRVRFMQKMILTFDESTRNKLFDPFQKPVSSKERFMIYANSNCVQYRETALAYFTDLGVVDIAGACNGSKSPRRQPNSINVAPAPDHVRDASWRENSKVMGTYRFCIAMENRYADGYISEKILNAFLGGCLPIYYGDRGVFDIFNKDAFVYYDIHNPQEALDRVRYLDSNRAAYDEVMAQPILARGNLTVEDYFSLSDDIGGGTLKRRIHTMMGLT